ncbi:MAG: tetratricopeptide repeat protein [Chloroflexota bacterium]
MSHLSIHLFGNLLVTQDGTTLALPTRKAEAVLAYLVCQRRPIAREVLATMFWDDSSADQAAANLRKLLSALRQLLGDYLHIERQVVAIDNSQPIYLDTDEFVRLFAQWQKTPDDLSPLATAVSHYQDGFLTGLHLPDSPDFDNWVALERERWRHMAVTALYALVAAALHTRQYEMGRQYAALLLTLAPLEEAAHRQWMLLLARCGETAAALAHYQQCCALLAQELGVTPTAETVDLAARIETAVAHPPNLPIPQTPFIGRHRELAAIQQQLDDPACRLLTLVGPGGIGKSRLALHAAQERVVDYLHGIHFVSLASLETAVAFIPMLAAALNIPLDGKQAPEEQLLAALRPREMLLILDNGETLLTAATLSAADFLPRLLQQAPQLKILATSQERFNFPGEYIIDVDGLPLPTRGADSAAIALFCTRATLAQPDFILTPANGPAITTICRLIDGSPLGIELAAASMRTYTPAEIAAEIAADLDFLDSQQPDAPSRHLSLRAVFNYTWRHLLPEEQETLKRLSVFRGSFALETAVSVTQTSPHRLLSLVDKSILRLLPDSRQMGVGHYQIHATLRRFSASLLAPQTAVSVQQSHSRHYMKLLAACEHDLTGLHAAAAQSAIRQQWADVRAAWDWAVHHADTESVQHALTSLLRYYLVTGPHQEADALLHEAITVTTNQPLLARLHAERARILNKLGMHETAVTFAQTALALHAADTAVFTVAHMQWGVALVGLGQFETAAAHLTQAQDSAQASHDQPAVADVLRSLVAVAAYQGDYAQARTYCLQALSVYEQIGDRRGLGGMHNNLGVIHRNLGDYAAAQHHYQQALTIVNEIGDVRVESQIRNNLGIIARSQGDYAQARAHYEAALPLKRDVGDQQGEALALNNLANVAAELGDYASAQTHYQQALTMFRQMGRRRDEAMVLSNLGLLHHLREQDAAAVAYSQQALDIARELGDRSTAAFALTHLGHAHLGLAETAVARTAYQQAYEIRTELGESALALESLAGLARTYPPASAEALAHTTAILTYLQENNLTGSEQPLRIYLTCYQILHAHQDARAPSLLQNAQQLLNDRANHIGDPVVRQSFLENVPTHRALRDLIADPDVLPPAGTG